MQKLINDIMAEVTRVIKCPPSRPIRLMFMENQSLYEMAQNKIKDMFSQNEIFNLSTFYETDVWNQNEKEISDIETKKGSNSKQLQRKLCEILEKALIQFIKDNAAEKVLVIADEELYALGLDPIHFLSAYMMDNRIILNEEIPIIWLTIGEKEEYGVGEYKYYHTENSYGRTIKVTQSTFSSCIKDYKIYE